MGRLLSNIRSGKIHSPPNITFWPFGTHSNSLLKDTPQDSGGPLLCLPPLCVELFLFRHLTALWRGGAGDHTLHRCHPPRHGHIVKELQREGILRGRGEGGGGRGGVGGVKRMQ